MRKVALVFPCDEDVRPAIEFARFLMREANLGSVKLFGCVGESEIALVREVLGRTTVYVCPPAWVEQNPSQLGIAVVRGTRLLEGDNILSAKALRDSDLIEPTDVWAKEKYHVGLLVRPPQRDILWGGDSVCSPKTVFALSDMRFGELFPICVTKLRGSNPIMSVPQVRSVCNMSGAKALALARFFHTQALEKPKVLVKVRGRGESVCETFRPWGSAVDPRTSEELRVFLETLGFQTKTEIVALEAEPGHYRLTTDILSLWGERDV